MDQPYKPGEWKAICDICGFQFLASELTLDFRNRRVCSEDLDKRNPQEFVRPKKEELGVSWTRKDADTTITTLVADSVIVASLDSQLFYANAPNGLGIFITFPASNSALYKGVPVTLIICNTGTNPVYTTLPGNPTVPSYTSRYFLASTTEDRWIPL